MVFFHEPKRVQFLKSQLSVFFMNNSQLQPPTKQDSQMTISN